MHVFHIWKDEKDKQKTKFFHLSFYSQLTIIMIDTDLKHSDCWFHNIPCEMKQLSWKRVSLDFVSGSSGASAHFILKLC